MFCWKFSVSQSRAHANIWFYLKRWSRLNYQFSPRDGSRTQDKAAKKRCWSLKIEVQVLKQTIMSL